MGNILVDISAVSHPGRVRANNEDMAYANGIYFNNIEKPQFDISGVQSGKFMLFSVCDGMGGENAGEKASYEAVKLLDNYHHKLTEVKIKDIYRLIEYLKDYIKQANDKIYSLWANSADGRMGSTFTGLAFHGKNAVALNLGDSRVYMMRQGILTRLTKDHTEAERLASMGLIQKDEVETHKGSHVLTRHFGTTPEEGIMEADFSDIVRIKKGDTFLLCSDGLTDMVKDQKIKQLLEQKGKTSIITRSLLEEALRNGGKDNVTAVVVRVKCLMVIPIFRTILKKAKNFVKTK